MIWTPCCRISTMCAAPILIGEAAERFAALLEGKVESALSHTLDQAFQAATDDARRKRAEKNRQPCWLAPACASFDQFPNFEARGEAFKALVESPPRDSKFQRPPPAEVV